MKAAECENKWCVYYEASRCVLTDISVNAYGMCDCCIMAEVDEEALGALRRRQRETLESR
ncbi:MAG: hypothetical protein Q4C72_03680 [Eubacteriales bacterium]|nr:hypothetical protein [Eubacteriales bacterium]